MAAEFKSHVLLRDEKGFAGIAFKRLILAGVGGGLSFSVCRLTLPDYALILGAGVGVTLLILTGTRGGLPLWQRTLYRLRGALLLLAIRQPAGVAARVARLLDLPLDLVTLDAAVVFAPPQAETTLELREWVTFAHARETDGLEFIDSPLKESAHG